MKTITLQVNNEIYDKLITILSQFNTNDIKVFKENSFEEDKQYLGSQLSALGNENAIYISIDELDSVLEETIERYGH